MKKDEKQILCTFCESYVHHTIPSFWSKYGQKYGQSTGIILEENYFLALTGLGALTEGYVLIIPKGHYISIGAIPENQFQALTDFCNRVRTIIEQVFGPVVIFEHGMSHCHSAGGCIDHAHIHFIPTETGFRSEFKANFKEERIKKLVELKKFADNNIPYLFYENTRKEKFVYLSIDNIPSQYIRKLWAKKVGKPDEWDWAVSIGEINIARTIDRIQQYLTL